MADNSQIPEEKKDKKAAKKAAKEAKKAEKEAKKKAKKEAKKNGEVFDDDEEEEGSKVGVLFATIIIIIVWLAILALIIKADVGGFGSTVMAPILKNIPYVNMILPSTELDEGSKLSSDNLEASKYDTLEEALDRIKELEIELQDADDSISKYKNEISELESENERLSKFEKEQKEFEEKKLKFDEEVVFNDNAPDIKEYKSYYESIDPTNAELIYKEVLEQQQEDEKIKDYVSMYSEMKASEAAEIFNNMTGNLDLVAKILTNMEADTSSAILGKMDTDIAAKLTVMMEPK